MIVRGTTPLINVIFTDSQDVPIDLSVYDKVFITICDKKNHVEIDKERMIFNEDLSIDARLTQEETLSLRSEYLFVQIRASIGDDAIASNIVTTTLGNILKEGVI